MIYLRAGFSDSLNCDYSIFVNFHYNPNYVQLIKSLSKRCFRSAHKDWEVAYECYEELLGTLNSYNIPYNADQFMQSIYDLQATVAQMQQKMQQEQNKIIDLSTVQFKTKPYPYQLTGIEYGLNHNCFLLADEQGLGKSLMSANIAALKRGGDHCLIICGYDSLQFNWVKEVEQHTNEKARVLGQRTKRNGRVYLGSIQDRLDDLLNLDNIEEFFIITAMTTIRQCTKTKYINKNGKEKDAKHFYIAEEIEKLCKDGKIGRIIIDEGQVIKNFDSSQTQATLKIKSCPFKIVATGTPIMNKNLDLYPILSWLGYEKSNYYEFMHNYCVMGGFKGKEPIGNKNNDILHQTLQKCMLRRLKSEELDLPPKIYIDELLEMDGKQWSFYNKMASMAKAELAKMKGNKVKLLASTLNLRKITCHPGWVDVNYKDSVKYERARQIVNEACQNNRKTIIFSCFTTPFEADQECVNLAKQLEPFNPAMIIGDTKDRMEQVEKFQNDPSCFVIVGSIGAMGTGLTLNAASNVIFLDEPWNRALKDQACDRAHRIGTKYPVNIYTLMCKGTVDEGVHKTVMKKGRMADEIVDGVTIEELENILENGC